MNEVAEHWQRVVFLTLPDGRQPAQEFLSRIDPRMRDRLLKYLGEVVSDTRRAAAPSGAWKPMRDGLGGVWEIRCTGPRRSHYRLFVLVDKIAVGTKELPRFVVLDGAEKANATLLPESFYRRVEILTTEYWRSLDAPAPEGPG